MGIYQGPTINNSVEFKEYSLQNQMELDLKY